MDAPGGELSITVVIAARDAENVIGDCLSSVLPQLIAGDAVIVVDDHSSDGLARICAALGVPVVVNDGASGPYAARNRGVEQVTTDAIVFFDTRCRALDGWLDTHRRALSSGRAIISYSSVAVAPSPTIAGSAARHLDPFNVQTFRRLGFYPACNLGISRELFESLGGFGEVRSGGDADLCRRARRAGADFAVDSITRVEWHPRDGLRELLSQYRRYGGSSAPRHRGPAGVEVAETVALTPIRVLGTFIGKPGSHSSLRARTGAALAQSAFEFGVVRSAITRFSLHPIAFGAADSGSGGI